METSKKEDKYKNIRVCALTTFSVEMEMQSAVEVY
jgi:hypothetical protein